MNFDIKCLECKKGTLNIDLGEIFCDYNNLQDTFMVKNSVICPKCNKNISDRKFAIKLHDLLWKIFTANLLLISSEPIPFHLIGINLFRSEDYGKARICKSKPFIVNSFKELS